MTPRGEGRAAVGPQRRRRTTRARSASVSRRLFRAFTAYLLLLLVVAAAGVVSVSTVRVTRSTELQQERLGEATTAMMLAMTSAESSLRGYRLTGDPAFLAPYKDARGQLPREVRRALTAADAADERRLVRAQEAIGAYWFEDLAAPVTATVGRSVPTPTEAEAFRAASTTYRSLNTRLGAIAEERAAIADAEAVRAERLVLVLSAAALVLALAAAAIIQHRLHRALVTPLGAVVSTLGRLADGDHGARADADLGPREVQVVATSLNSLAEEAARLRAERAAVLRHREIAAEISGALRDEVLDGDPVTTAVQRLGQLMGVDRAYVRELDAADGAPSEHEWTRPPLAPLPESSGGWRYDLESSPRTQEAYSSMSGWVDDDTSLAGLDDPRVLPFLERTGATAVVAMPIGAGKDVLGLLAVLQVSGPRRWEQHEIELVTSVAADLGRALVVSRALEKQEHLVEQLRELDRTKTDFLSTVSHELRTPLTSIAGYLEMVREGDGGEVPPAMDAMLVIVERNAARLRSLIEDLLTLSRIESGTYRVTHEEVCVAQVAAMVVQSLRPFAEKGGVTVALEVEQADAMVLGDPGQLERAITNLASNAVKFTPEGGWVRIVTRVVEGRVVLEIADTGIGIPAEEQDQLFSRFFRASNASEMAIPGTGLGLTIVRSIVEHHAGELRLASVAGEGTTVTVDLPLLAGSRSSAATLASRAAIAASVESLARHELATRAPATVGAR